MKSPATSNLPIIFLDTGGMPVLNPLEWEPALVQIDIPIEDWQKVKIWLQSEALPVYLKIIGGQARVLVDWPRSGPGYFQLKMQLTGQEVIQQIVTVQPRKISPTAFTYLLKDLEEILPASVALALQQSGALAGLKIVPPGESTLAQELTRLKRAVIGITGRPGLAYVLKELASNPHNLLISNELWVRTEQARRPHPSRLQYAFAGHNLTVNNQPLKLIDNRVAQSVDIYENRLIKVFYNQVFHRLHRLVRRLEAASLSSSPNSLLEEVRSLENLLQNSRRQAAFLDEVTLPVYLPTQVTMVLLKRPLYRAALEGYLEFHKRAVVRLEEPALDAPLENLPYLYQVWGTLKVIQILLEVGLDLGYIVKKQSLAYREAGELVVKILPDGQPALVMFHPISGTEIRFVPERTYGKSGSYRSISFEQRPDIAIEIEPKEGPPRIYIFDPKYKLDSTLTGQENQDGSPKKIDIDKMHTYRDAIRDLEDQRIVKYAAILYPGPSKTFGTGLAALPAYPGLSTSLEGLLREILVEALTTITEDKF